MVYPKGLSSSYSDRYLSGTLVGNRASVGSKEKEAWHGFMGKFYKTPFFPGAISLF